MGWVWRRGVVVGWGALTGVVWLGATLVVPCGAVGGASLGGAGACFFVPLRTMKGLGPLELEAGVPKFN